VKRLPRRVALMSLRLAFPTEMLDFSPER